MIKQTQIIDPLETLQQDGFKKLNELLKINHHSPTSSSMPLGIYAFRYLFSTQEQRREFEGNANMAAGVAVNDAVQFHYSHDIWSFNPNQRKLAPHKNIKLSKDEATAKAMEKLPIVGRTDVHFTDFNASSQGVAASSGDHGSDAPFLSVCELKTSWSRAGRVKKDGTMSFSSAKLPSTPNINHLQQLAFYCFSLRKKMAVSPYLIYLTEDDFVIYTEKNCADLELQNLNNYYEQLVSNCIRKERLLSRYIDLDEPDMILAEIAKDVEPNFDHMFYWNIGAKHYARAKNIWRQV